MKRRGVLGLIGGAFVAGPSMAKQAVTAGMADLSLGHVSGGLMGSSGNVESASFPGDGTGYGTKPWALKQMAKVMGRSDAEHDYHKSRMLVHSLDPDLAVNRSLALHMKIRIQKDRDYQRSINSEVRWLKATIEGILNPDGWL